MIPFGVFAQPALYKSSPSDYAWKVVGTAGFTDGRSQHLSFAISPLGEPFVAYSDSLNHDRVNVQKFDGSNWIFVGTPGFSETYTGPLSLTFSPSGEPYIAFAISSVSGKLKIMKFNGTKWINVGNIISSYYGFSGVHIKVSPSGDPYVTYTDFENFFCGLNVIKFDGTNWITVGTPDFAEPYPDAISFSFSPNGEPYVAFQDRSTFSPWTATVMKYDGINWITVGNASCSDGTAYDLSLSFSPYGQPYVAYQDVANSYKATVKMFDGNTWICVGSVGFTTNFVASTSIAFSSTGQPFLVFSEYNNDYWKATVVKFTGSEWTPVGITSYSASGNDSYTSLAFSPSGQPYIAFMDGANYNRATVMKYDSVYYGITDYRQSQISVYPNPAKSTITINLTTVTSKLQYIKVTDLAGTKMFETKTFEKKIILDIENYPAGIYFIELKLNESYNFMKFCKI